MKAKILVVLVCMLALSGCYHFLKHDYNCYRNYCQKDYWADSNFEVFGRKNCVGDTGKWVATGSGTTGYYCTGPHCVTTDNLICKSTCRCY